MSGALARYRFFAYLTGVLLLLLTFDMILRYGFDQAGMGAWVYIGHGYAYLAYVAVTADLWFRTRLALGPTVLVVLAGTIPGMSFVAERWITHRVRPMIAAQARPEEREAAGKLGA